MIIVAKSEKLRAIGLYNGEKKGSQLKQIKTNYKVTFNRSFMTHEYIICPVFHFFSPLFSYYIQSANLIGAWVVRRKKDCNNFSSNFLNAFDFVLFFLSYKT